MTRSSINLNIKQITWIITAVFLTSCTSLPKHQSLSDIESKDLIPIRSYVANLKYSGEFQISPDGTKISYKAVEHLKTKIFIKDLINKKIIKIPQQSNISQYTWVSDSESIVHLVPNPQNSQYYRLALRGIQDTSSLILAPKLNEKYSLYYSHAILDSKFDIVVKILDKNNKNPIYYRLNYKTSHFTRLTSLDDNIEDWFITKKGKVVGRVRLDKNKKIIELLENGDYVTVMSCDKTDTIKYFNNTEEYISLLTNCGTDKIILQNVFKINQQTVPLEMPEKVDISQAIPNYNNGGVLFAIYHSKGTKIDIYDSHFQFIKDFFENNYKTTFVVSYDRLQNKFIFRSSDLTGNKYFLVNISKGTIKTIKESDFSQYKKFNVKYHQIEIPTKKGGIVYGYLARPDYTSFNNAPTIIYLHGGPETRGYNDFNRDISFLTNRGYTVLNLNYFGSTGYGKLYLKKPYKQPEIILDNIDEAITWLINERVADPNNIAIMGGSYGGYLSLLSTYYDDRIKCTIAINSLVNLEKTALDFLQIYGEERYQNLFMNKYYGSPLEIKQNYSKNLSPYELSFENSNILLIHSKYDQLIPLNHAKEFYKKFKDSNDMKFLVLTKSGHSIQTWSSNLRIFSAIESYLSTCLGGAVKGYDYFNLFKIFDF